MEKNNSKIFINLLKMNKKGALPLNFFMGVIVVLFGFVILLMFYTQLFQSVDVDREACYQSVVSRGLLPSVVQGAKDLSCKTQKICITGKIIGKGDCSEFTGEEDFKTIRVGNSQSNLEKIEKIYAMEMIDCWSMMGKGEISLYSQELAKKTGFGEVYPTCVVCSRVAIDEESLDDIDFSQMNLYRYMATHFVGGTEESYLQYLSGTEDTGFSLKEGSFDIGGVRDAENDFVMEPEEITVSLDEELNKENIPKETAIVFSQISAPKHSGVFANTAVATAGLIGFSGVARGVVIKAASIVGGLGTIVAGIGFLGIQQANVAYNRAVVATTCSDFSTGNSDIEGCSSIRAIDYKTENILQYCGAIESIA